LKINDETVAIVFKYSTLVI